MLNGVMRMVPQKFCIRSDDPTNEISRYQRLILVIFAELIGDYFLWALLSFLPALLTPTLYSTFMLCTAATLYLHEARAHAFRVL